MAYLPEVAWSTIASNVTLGASAYRYYITVNPLDPNEAGASPMTVAINDWFIDFAGYPFLIEEINGSILTVYDILERGDGVVSAYAPYANKLGYVYRPLNGAIILTQAQLRKLDQSASDIIYPIEKGITWGYRGLQLNDGTVALTNVTKLELVGLTLTDNTNDGWQGGSELTLTANLIGLNDVSGTTSQGCLIYGASSSEFNLLSKSTSSNYYLKNSGTDNNPAWASITEGDLVLSDVTTNNASTSRHGFLSKLPNDTSKWLRGDGSWATISTDYGNFLDSVIRMVIDNTFDPGGSPVNGDRYIILNASSIHANFGTINKDLAGNSLTLGNNDIIQYVTSALEYRIAYDSSSATAPATVTVGYYTVDKQNHDWTYNTTDDIWIDRGTTTLHNSLSDLNTGVGQYYHLTSEQHDLVAGITSTFTELNYLDGTTVTSGRILFGDGTKITNDSNLYWDYTNDRLSIGTTTPSYDFESALSTASLGNKALIVGQSNEIWSQPQTNSNAALYINYRGYADGLTQFRDLHIANGKGTIIASFIGASGNVGIGTTAPTNKLDIRTTSDNLNIVTSFSNTINRLTALNKGTAITLGYSPSEYFTKIATVYENQNPDYLNPALAFYTMYNTYVGGTEVERMRISSNGNVGIGTTTPQSRLDLGNATGGNSIVWGGSSGTNHYASIGTMYSSANLVSGVGIKLSTSSNNLLYSYTGTVGVSGILQSLEGDTYFFNQIYGSRTKDAPFDWSANTKMIISSNGNVGIGTTSPSVKLDVNGTGNFATSLKVGTLSGLIKGTGGVLSAITGTQGDIIYYNGTNWVTLAAGTNGYFLKTQGSGANPVWSAVSGGTVTSVAAGNGMNFTTITNSGSVTLGTPSGLTSITTNSVTSNSHTHSIEIAHQTSTTSSSTPTPTGNYKENEYYLTALAAGATFAAPSGTPVNGNTLLIRIKDNGTARTLAWNSIYRAVGVTLPTTTTASKTLYIGCIYNSTDSKWDVVSVVKQA